MLSPRRAPGRQRGLSVVELMVGVTIGLLVVAASAMLVSGQLGENRRLLLETQVQQDLRAASDIVVRELRRAGARIDAATGAVWVPGSTDVSCNRYATVTTAAGSVHFRYYRDSTNNGPIGFMLEDGVLRSAVHGPGSVSEAACEQTESPANWQDLTDARTLKITRFVVTPTITSEQIPCPRLCAGDTRDCWPRIEVRQYAITLDGEAVSDPAVKRSVSAVVRLRNDRVANQPPTATQTCPA